MGKFWTGLFWTIVIGGSFAFVWDAHEKDVRQDQAIMEARSNSAEALEKLDKLQENLSALQDRFNVPQQ